MWADPVGRQPLGFVRLTPRPRLRERVHPRECGPGRKSDRQHQHSTHPVRMDPNDSCIFVRSAKRDTLACHRILVMSLCALWD